MLESMGLKFERQYVWVKVGVPIPSWHLTVNKKCARYLTSNYTHEMVYVMAKERLDVGGVVSFDDTLENDVFRINQSEATLDIPTGIATAGTNTGLNRRALKAHPAVFPVKLPIAFLQHYTAPGELVAEPFCGSGTTIIACENLGRKCRAMEISPGYVAVALQRFKDMTGKDPQLIKD